MLGRHQKVRILHVANYFCPFQEAQVYADENGLLFMETSAKTALNVNETFLAIGKCVSPEISCFSQSYTVLQHACISLKMIT